MKVAARKGTTMRRLLVPITIVILIGSLSGSAGASTLRVRVDANDSSSNLDIHKVITNLSATTMYLRLKSWDRFKLREMRNIWVLVLDTVGTHRPDRTVVIYRHADGIACAVFDYNTPFQLGRRLATRPDGKSAACHLPRDWFGHIDRAVRFRAATYRGRHAIDKAPPHGRMYRWI
jgi:hypothetical protein